MRRHLPVTVSLVNDQTGIVAASATVTGWTGDWKEFTFTLRPARYRPPQTTT